MTAIITSRPILFSGPMVRALLAGTKTQTRRVVTVPWHKGKRCPPYSPVCEVSDGKLLFSTKEDNYYPAENFCPYGQPGDRLWVRESCYIWGKWVKNGLSKKGKQKWSFWPVGKKVMYEDNRPAIVLGPKSREREGWFRRPSIFMYRWASRITLEITDVRVQRLQEISEEDAMAEGVNWQDTAGLARFTAKKLFRTLWDSINASRGFDWDSNPWVWAVSFKRVKP